MALKTKVVNFFLSKINVDFFSLLIKKYRILRPFYKIAAQRLIDQKFPRHAFVETTSLCNLACKMCPRNFNPVRLGTMDQSLFEKIIDEAARFGERTFSLHLFGEPLLDPKFTERIAYIKKANPRNSILLTTNGVLMNENISGSLIKYRVDKTIISIHSPDAKTYQSITGRDQLKIAEENVKGLVKLKKEANAEKPKIFLRLVRTKDNFNQVADFKKKWYGYPIKIEIREEHNYGGQINHAPQRKPLRRYPCYHLWFSPGINWDGEVTICCDDVGRQAIVGNVKDGPLAGIWQGEAMQKYRQYHLRGEYYKIPICRDCDVWQIYPDIFFKWQKRKNDKKDF